MTGRTIAAADAASIASDTAFLAANCACPTEVQARLRAWASELRAGCAAATSRCVLSQVAEDLLIIAHSNAAFRLTPSFRHYRGPAVLQVDDLGGYFAAHAVLKTLVAAAPLDDEDRARLIGHILSATTRHMRQVEAALLRM
jgi:hypothetical protein